MGLRIHYYLRSECKLPGHARKIVDHLRAKALELSFDGVGDLVEVKDCETILHQGITDDPSFWLLIQATRYREHNNQVIPVVPKRFVAFSVSTCPGYPPATFGLAFHPIYFSLPYPPALQSGKKLRSNWFWSSSCVTHDAYQKKAESTEDFVKRHMNVIALLDYAAKLGIVDDVDDEGNYWQSRDAKGLSQIVNTRNQIKLIGSKVIEESEVVVTDPLVLRLYQGSLAKPKRRKN